MHHCVFSNNYNIRKSIANNTNNPPMKNNNKSVKALFTCDVQKNTALGVGSSVLAWLCLVLHLSLDPSPHAVISTHNGALINQSGYFVDHWFKISNIFCRMLVI